MQIDGDDIENLFIICCWEKKKKEKKKSKRHFIFLNYLSMPLLFQNGLNIFQFETIQKTSSQLMKLKSCLTLQSLQ